MIDIKQIYEVMEWYKTCPADGESVGLFIPVPDHISSQFPPEGKMGEDESPAHITFCYIGTFNLELEEKLKNLCKDFFSSVKPFKAKLGKPRKFVNDEGQTISHSPIKSSKLMKLNDELKKMLSRNQVQYSTKYPEYKPHITIAYINPGEKNAHKDVKPSGEWMIDNIWLWGTKEPHMFYLGG